MDVLSDSTIAVQKKNNLRALLWLDSSNKVDEQETVKHTPKVYLLLNSK